MIEKPLDVDSKRVDKAVVRVDAQLLIPIKAAIKQIRAMKRLQISLTPFFVAISCVIDAGRRVEAFRRFRFFRLHFPFQFVFCTHVRAIRFLFI